MKHRTITKSGMLRPRSRYSNYDSGMFQQLPSTGDYEDLPADFYSSGSSSSSSGGGFDWGNLINSLSNLGNTFISSYWNKGDKYKAQAYETMYNQQQKTTTVLWVVIGLIVALGVVLLLRKTK